MGMRHDDKPCILIIDAKMAWNDEIKFYFGNEKVWLADKIPSSYIRKNLEKNEEIVLSSSFSS